MRESDILRDIRIALSRINGCDFMRVSQGYTERDGRAFRTGSAPGTPDLLGCVKGQFVALEVKTPTGRVSEVQQRWAVRWQRCGAIVATVHSVDEAVSIVLSILRDGK